MDSTLAGLYARLLGTPDPQPRIGALLEQPGILSQAATSNPLMMAKALRQSQANPRPSISGLMDYPQTWQQFGDNLQANFPTDSPASVRQAAFDAAKNAGPLATVWHGSPHSFDKMEDLVLKAREELSKLKIGMGSESPAYMRLLEILKENEQSRPALLRVLYPQIVEKATPPTNQWQFDIWKEANEPMVAGIGLARINYPELSSIVRGQK